MKLIYLIIIFLLNVASVMAADQPESICYGTTEKGRIENAWQLPSSGKNFSVYSSLGAMTGRNYVHSKVYTIVLDAYKDLLLKEPNKVFVYGETELMGSNLQKLHFSSKQHRDNIGACCTNA